MTPRRQRGAAMAMMMVVLLSLTMLVITNVAGSADEADSGLRRVLMTRTRYAAEGATTMLRKHFAKGLNRPAAGTRWRIGSTEVRLVTVPRPTASGQVVLEANSDLSRYRRSFTGRHVPAPP